jgi:hypothetical protein
VRVRDTRTKSSVTKVLANIHCKHCSTSSNRCCLFCFSCSAFVCLFVCILGGFVFVYVHIQSSWLHSYYKIIFPQCITIKLYVSAPTIVHYSSLILSYCFNWILIAFNVQSHNKLFIVWKGAWEVKCVMLRKHTQIPPFEQKSIVFVL